MAYSLKKCWKKNTFLAPEENTFQNLGKNKYFLHIQRLQKFAANRYGIQKTKTKGVKGRIEMILKGKLDQHKTVECQIW